MKAKIILCILLCLLISPICAETFSGVLGGTTSASTSYAVTDTATSAEAGTYMRIYSIENTLGLQSVVLFPNTKMTFAAGAPASNHTPFKAYTYPVATAPYFTGEIGYQRIYDSGGTEQPGYMWITISDYNTNMSLYSGTLLFSLNYNSTDVYDMKAVDVHSPTSGVTAFTNSIGSQRSGTYSFYRAESISNTYGVTKPSGLGIEGNITKPTSNPSRAYIYNATNNAILSSQSGVTNDTFNFNIPNAATVFLGIKTSMGLMYNTSPFWYTSTAPPPAISGSPNTTTITIIDGHTYGLLSTPNINAHNLITSNWSNVTTNPYVYSVVWDTPIDIFVSKTGYLPNSLTNVLGGDRDYGITLIPIELNPFPNTTLLSVLVMNNNIAISGAYVQAQETFNGSVLNYDGYTNNAGVVTFIVNNDSVVKATASKSGFSASTVTETITGQTYAMLITLNSPYIIPTSTPYTTLPTIAPIITSVGGTVISGNATVCSATSDGTMIGELKKNIACMGFKDYLSQSLALAALIVMVFMLIGGRYGKGLGTALGAVVGFVLSLALGIIPFWVFVALIILAIGAVAFKAVMG